MKPPRLKELGRWFSGGTPPSARREYWDGELPWLSGKDFDKHNLRRPTKFITRESARLHSTVMPAGRSVLVLVRGMALAHGLPSVLLPFEAAINQDVRGLVVDPRFDPVFISYSLRGHKELLDAHIDRAAHGTARARDTVYAERLRWFPNLDAQRTVAEFLDREGQRITDAIETAGLVLDTSREAYASLARHLILDADFPSVLIRLVARPGTGHTPSRSHPEYWVPDECNVPWLGLPDVWQVRDDDRDIVTETSEHVSSQGLANSSAVVHPAGTVFLSRTASVGFVGQMGVEMAVTQHYMTWTCGPELKPEYLIHALRAMRPEILALAQGATHGTIYMPDLHGLKIPLPSLEEQQAIVDQLQPRIEARRLVAPAGGAVQRVLMTYRESLIHEAVTGKLDVTAMSDSAMQERLHAASEDRLREAIA